MTATSVGADRLASLSLIIASISPRARGFSRREPSVVSRDSANVADLSVGDNLVKITESRKKLKRGAVRLHLRLEAVHTYRPPPRRAAGPARQAGSHGAPRVQAFPPKRACQRLTDEPYRSASASPKNAACFITRPPAQAVRAVADRPVEHATPAVTQGRGARPPGFSTPNARSARSPHSDPWSA